MALTFTSLDMLRYLYNEMNADEARAFSDWLHADPIRLEEYNELREQVSILSLEKHKPSDTSIRIILDYSRHSSGELV